MFTDNYSDQLQRLHSKEITFVQFLEEVGCKDEFTKWCANHHVKEDEGAAQCFFDHYGFEESEVVKEFVEPVS